MARMIATLVVASILIIFGATIIAGVYVVYPQALDSVDSMEKDSLDVLTETSKTLFTAQSTITDVQKALQNASNAINKAQPGLTKAGNLIKGVSGPFLSVGGSMTSAGQTLKGICILGVCPFDPVGNQLIGMGTPFNNIGNDLKTTGESIHEFKDETAKLPGDISNINTELDKGKVSLSKLQAQVDDSLRDLPNTFNQVRSVLLVVAVGSAVLGGVIILTGFGMITIRRAVLKISP